MGSHPLTYVQGPADIAADVVVLVLAAEARKTDSKAFLGRLELAGQ